MVIDSAMVTIESL